MKFKILLVGCWVCFLTSSAQSVQSPYTINGIGEINTLGLAQNMSMGGLGISHANVWFVNNLNPALLTANSLTTFHMGVSADTRLISNGRITESSTTASLGYLAFAFPISPKYTTSVGVMPYSSVNYNIVSEQLIPGSSVVGSFNYLGSGGLSQAYWSHGFKLFKGFSLGLRATYIFGAVRNEVSSSLSNDNLFQMALMETTTYSDGNFTAGLHYKYNVKEETYIHFGATYDISTDLSGNRFAVLERRDFSGRGSPIDTLLNEDVKFNLPQSISFGFSLERLNKYVIGVEANVQDWESGSGFENDNTQFANTIRIAVGGEYIPDYLSVNSYFNRITYRAGFSYQTSPYLINGHQISDIGVSFGWSLPVSRANSIDMGFKIGRNGTLDNNLVRENYFKFTLAATVNDRWFVRRKYD